MFVTACESTHGLSFPLLHTKHHALSHVYFVCVCVKHVREQ